MAKPILIAPSILSARLAELKTEIECVDRGGADYIHIDVMDGHFVPNLTWGAPIVAAVRAVTQRALDVHLMIENPDRFIDDYAKAGADIIGIHLEADRHAQRTLSRIRSLGKKSSLSLNPQTGLTELEYLLDDLDQVLIMSVNPGFGGQKFLPLVLPKIEALRERIEARGLKIDIEVDGGIGVETAGLVASAGANVLVAGAAVFGQADRPACIAAIRKAAEAQA